MKIKLNKTLYIGLGGFGADVIVRIKSQMLDNFGEVPPMIRFLAMDTDSIQKVMYQNSVGESIFLFEDEFIQFTVWDVASYVNTNPDITDFYHRDVLKRSLSISGGTKKFRANGRLALIANDSLSFRNRLTNTINSLAHWSGSMDDKYDVATDAQTNIFVFFSLAGGTGAGIFIDLPFIFRQIGIGLQNIRINAIGLQPDVFSTLGQGVSYEKLNAIAAITEYDLIADGTLQEFIPDPTHPARLVTTLAGSYQVDPANLYDNFILVNNESTTGVRYESSKEMTDIIAKAMYLEIGATGGTRNSALDMISALKAGQNFKGKALRYLGLGYAEMVFDPKQAASYYSLLQTNSICNNLLSPATEPKNIDEEVQQCFDQWRIQEDENRDDVINFLADNKPKQSFTGVNEFDESSAIFIKSRKESYIRRIQDDLNKSIFNPRGTLDQITRRALNDLQSCAINKTNAQGGVNYIKELLPNMIGRFKWMMLEMTEERKEFETQLDRYENSYRTKISEIEDAINIPRYKVFTNRRNKIEEACEEYVSVVNSEAICIYEIERRTAAMAFYRKMIEKAETILHNLFSFEERLRKVVESTAIQIQKIKNRNPKEPFCIDVTPEYVRTMRFEQSDVDMCVFSEQVKVSELAFKGQLDPNELYTQIFGYTNSLPQAQAYLKTNLLEVLQGMPIERVKELFLRLKSSTVILRRIDYDVSIDTARSYIIGVYNTNHPAISANSKIGEILNEKFTSQGFISEFSNTKAINKITVCAYESAIPAFLIKNFEKYAFDLKHKSNTISEDLWYSNKHWGEVIMKNKYSIFPFQEDANKAN